MGVVLALAIIEDEAIHVNKLRVLIQDWCTLQNAKAEIYVYPNVERFYYKLGDQHFFDGLFLDVEFPNSSNGMEVAKKVRDIDPLIPIVFVTNHSEYVFSGYQVNALDYLIKPVENEKGKLFKALDKIRNYAETSTHQSYLINCSGTHHKIPFRSIYYFQMHSHYVEAHTTAGNFRFLKRIQDLQTDLPSLFVRCHRSVIVNIDCVTSIGKKELVLTNGEVIAISATYLDTINRVFLDRFEKTTHV